jgi:hypothetical protein
MDSWIIGIISGAGVYAVLMGLHHAGLWIGRVQARRRTARHFEITGYLPCGSSLLLPEGYQLDDDGIIASKEDV